MAKRVVTDWNPSFDGLLAPWMATQLTEEWKGAEVIFAKSDEEADRLGAEGALVLNCGSGEFSGHPHDKYPNDCASTLFAKKHGLIDDPKLQRLLCVAVVSDNKPLNKLLSDLLPGKFADLEHFALASMPANIKLLYGAGYTPQDALKWVSVYFYAEWKNQQRFWEEAFPEFKEHAIRITVPAGDMDRSYPIAAIRSDSDKMLKLAQSKAGGRQALLFQMRSTGNWAIFSFRGPLDEVVATVRHEEMKKHGTVVNCSRKDLMADGTMPEVPNINYHRNGNQIFNGSLTHPDVELTTLGFEEIWELIQIGINTDRAATYWREQSIALAA